MMTIIFAFYGRVSTEDQQDPQASLNWQLARAVALTERHGAVAEQFFDIGQSRSIPWKRRPEAARSDGRSSAVDGSETTSSESAASGRGRAPGAGGVDLSGIHGWLPLELDLVHTYQWPPMRSDPAPTMRNLSSAASVGAH